MLANTRVIPVYCIMFKSNESGLKKKMARLWRSRRAFPPCGKGVHRLDPIHFGGSAQISLALVRGTHGRNASSSCAASWR